MAAARASWRSESTSSDCAANHTCEIQPLIGSGRLVQFSRKVSHNPRYGFNAKKDLLAQLLALNQEVAAKIEKGSPVTAPGVPKNYPDAKKRVTEDCIRSQPI
ncbi:MAG: hypothetical protein ABSB84_10705 [Verrucomicrobiota bacterium]|jgi:hypothetical protein